jgi:hypothetical protein
MTPQKKRLYLYLKKYKGDRTVEQIMKYMQWKDTGEMKRYAWKQLRELEDMGAINVEHPKRMVITVNEL